MKVRFLIQRAFALLATLLAIATTPTAEVADYYINPVDGQVYAIAT